MGEMYEQPLWLDVSSWQGQLNSNALAQSDGFDKIYGMFSRAGWGQNGGYIDNYFARNWEKSNPYYRSSYWAYWDYFPLQHQLDLWYQANPIIDFMPRLWDLEVEQAPSEFLSEQSWLASEKVKERDGHRFIIYSRVDILERTLCKYWTPDMLNSHYYLLAQYDLGDGQEYNGIVIPDGINPENILWKQTSSKIPMYDGSGPIDRDRWIWTDAATMHDWLNEIWGSDHVDPDPPIIIPDPPEDCCEDVEEIKTIVDELGSAVISLDDEVEDMQGEIERLEVNVESIEGKVSTLRTDVDAVTVTADNNHTSIGLTRTELRDLEDRVEDVERKNVQLETAIGGNATSISELEKRMGELESMIEDYESLVEINIENINIQLGEIGKDISGLKTRLRMFELLKKLFGKDNTPV